MFTNNDKLDFQKRGIKATDAEKQIYYFKKGFPYINLNRPAAINDGIIKLSTEDVNLMINEYDTLINNLSIVKFVPASGAASRMFKDLFSFLEDNSEIDENILLLKYPSVKVFFDNITQFAFYNSLIKITNNNIDLLSKKEIIDLFLNSKGLNYGQLPKAVLAFHKYNSTSRTAFEEHLVEGALYAKNSDNTVNIHFTVTPEHMELFKNLENSIVKVYEKEFNVKYNISYSIQDPSTDTIAVDINNSPFREKNGELLFRPAGHGALIYNLNNIDFDLAFIKNIDNVVPDSIKSETITWKKALACIVINYTNIIKGYLNRIDNGEFSEALNNEIINFFKNNLHQQLNFKTFSTEETSKQLKSLLERPVRACGMVVNTGEPGGGPFWVNEKNGKESLQIIESSQINFSDSAQEKIFKNASYFNPVDLVCSLKDYKGNKHNLLNYVDSETGFISNKSKDGKDLKAMELPGLWNGAMAKWNTIFVEVPIITFNPVKTINDLLRIEHRQQ